MQSNNITFCLWWIFNENDTISTEIGSTLAEIHISNYLLSFLLWEYSDQPWQYLCFHSPWSQDQNADLTIMIILVFTAPCSTKLIIFAIIGCWLVVVVGDDYCIIIMIIIKINIFTQWFNQSFYFMFLKKIFEWQENEKNIGT